MRWFPCMLLGLFVAGCAMEPRQDRASADRPPRPETVIPQAPARSVDPAPAKPRKKIDPDTRQSGQAQAPSPPAPQEPGAGEGSLEVPRQEEPVERPQAAAAAQSPDRVTALRQTESEDDVRTTARIRQALIGDDALSFRAKNVLIVTNGEQVVLQGRVASPSEAERIRSIAGRMTTKPIEDRLTVAQ